MQNRLLPVLAVIVAFVFVAFAPGPTFAQPASPQPSADANRAEIEALVDMLKNDAEREKLIAQLELMLQARRAQEQSSVTTPEHLGSRILAQLSDGMEWMSHDLVLGLRTIFDARRLKEWALAQAGRPEARDRWLDILWKVSAALAAGLIVEWLVRSLLRRPRHAMVRSQPVRWKRVLPLAARAMLDLIPLAAFAAAGYAALALVQPSHDARLVALGLMNAYLGAGLVLLAGRLVLAPESCRLRLPPIADVDANYLYVWLRRLANVAIYGYMIAATARLLGMPMEGAAALTRVIGLFVALMLVVLILQNRTAVATWIRGKSEDGGALRIIRARLGDVWHVLASVYVFGMFVVWALAVEDGFAFVLQGTVLTAAILAAARLAQLGMHVAARRIFALGEDVRQRFPGLEARADRYLPLMERGGSVVIWAIALLMLLEAWGFDAFAPLETETGRAAISSLATSAFVVVAAVLIWEAASAWIERYLAQESADGPAVSARARTLLPLLRTSLMVLLVIMASLIVLSEFGVNIAPLLAGAGVVGLAIGFGSQALVRDVITGAFILAENQMAVGDVVKVGSNSGLVERLTLRAIWLRGLDGTVQVVPFGEVKTVENMTKDFSFYLFDVEVAYREDTDRVIAIIREIGAELQGEPEYGDSMSAPIEVIGVDSFGENRVRIKARIPTKPIHQWRIGREFNRRLNKRFIAEKVEIPIPHRAIHFGADHDGNVPPPRMLFRGAEGRSHAG